MLINHDQQLLYIPGRTVHHASAGYRGSGKSDAKDAFIIADQARMRRGLHLMTTGDEIAVDLRSLTARRYDLAADRTRAINRLCAQILEYFPALDALIEGRFRRHRHATAILSMPGIGPLLGAEILGNLRRPRRYNRRLLRAFYLSAQVAITRCSQSKAFYERKRREGKAHKQPVLALARRGPNVVWALIRDDRVFQTGMPRPAATAA